MCSIGLSYFITNNVLKKVTNQRVHSTLSITECRKISEIQSKHKLDFIHERGDQLYFSHE